jgi:hypothetical protein
LVVLQEVKQVRVHLDISRYWPRDDDGEPRSVNSVHEELRGTPNEIGRNTLRLALEGRLDRGHFAHVIKLQRVVSNWVGREVALEELMTVEEGRDRV